MGKIKIIDVVSLGQTEDVKKLIKAGYDVNERDDFDNHPAIVAASRNDFETLKILVAAGAQLQVFNQAGENPMIWAERFNNLDMINFIKDTLLPDHPKRKN